MKKIFTLLFAVATLFASAQLSNSDAIGHLRPISRTSLPARHYTISPDRSVSNIAIDYDSFDIQWQHAHTPPDSMNYFSWNLNNNNPNDSLFSLRYAVQTYDTLIDVNNNFAGTPRAGTTVRVDSFDLILAEANFSGLNDTFIVQVFDKNAATVTGAGVTSKLNTTALWSDTIIANSDFFATNNNFYLATFYPNITLAAGHVAGIRVDFRGPIADQLYVLASYRDKCSSQELGDTNKIAPRNSSFYWNYTTQSAFANYTTNLAFNATVCKYFYIQNFLFYPYLTVTTAGGVTPPTVVTNAATSVTQTTATLNGSVNANGNSTTTSFEWGTTVAYGNTAAATPSPVTGNSATAITANLSGLTAATTYHFRAKGVNGGGTIYGADMTFTTLSGGGACTPAGGVTQGMSPASSAVACITQGQAYSQTFTFVIPASVVFGGNTYAINTVHFDSIGNLPAGITAAFNLNPATYAGGATGCFILTGTTSSPCGQYKMPIYVTANTAAGTFPAELSALAAQFSLPGFEMHFLRVTGAGGTCPSVNGAQTTTFTADPTCGIASTLSASATGTNVNCFGASTGSATATATGGTNYTYAWSNGGNTATINNLSQGTYTVTVTSGSSTATASYTVTQPGSAVTATTSSTQTVCGQSTGSATVTPQGGTPNYTFSWNSGQTTATASQIGAGNYTVTVTDNKGCTVTASASVTTPNGPSASSSTTNPNCFGGTGGVDVTVTGGTGTITYNWSNGTHTQDLTGVSAGTYNLTLTDANNCSFSVAATVSAPTALNVTGTTTNATSGNNGAVDVTVTGGTGTYSYAWSNTASSQDLTGLGSGTYTVTVTDQNACTATATFSITATGIQGLDLVTKFVVFPNPAGSSTNVQITLNESTDIKIEVLDLNGKLLVSENAGNVKQYNYTLNTSGLPNGIYAVRVSGTKLNVVQRLTISK